MRDFTRDELVLLEDYARYAGPTWRGRLIRDWTRSGSDYWGDWAPFQKMRNEVGPSRLMAFEFEFHLQD